MINNIKNIYLKYEEIINYLIVGVLTTVVSLGSYYLCVYTFLNPNISWQLQIANVISWVCAVTFAYFTNRKYVFKSHNDNILIEARDFYASRILTLLIDMALMFIFVTVLRFNDKLIKILVQVIITISNYIFSKLFVFKGKN
ncbi:MAG: GtrA family protein [Bacilli bacterium]